MQRCAARLRPRGDEHVVRRPGGLRDDGNEADECTGRTRTAERMRGPTGSGTSRSNPAHDSSAHDSSAHDSSAHDSSAHDSSAHDSSAHDNPAEARLGPAGGRPAADAARWRPGHGSG